MGGELWCGLAQNGVNLDFQVKFDIEGQCRPVHKTIGTLTKVFCIFGPNLVTLAWTGPELSRGQASDWHTQRQTDRHTHTDACNDNIRRPKLASGKKNQNLTFLVLKLEYHYMHILDKRVPVFHEDWFQLPVPPIDFPSNITASAPIVTFLGCWFSICTMMTSSTGNIFRVTDPLCGEFTGHRLIPRTKASDAELWCFLWSAPE